MCDTAHRKNEGLYYTRSYEVTLTGQAHLKPHLDMVMQPKFTRWKPDAALIEFFDLIHGESTFF